MAFRTGMRMAKGAGNTPGPYVKEVLAMRTFCLPEGSEHGRIRNDDGSELVDIPQDQLLRELAYLKLTGKDIKVLSSRVIQVS